MNSSAKLVGDVPYIVVTVTLTTPIPAGDVACISPSLVTENDIAGVAPKPTFVAPVNAEPKILIVLPPAVEPESGETLVTEGGGGVMNVNTSADDVEEVP